MEATVSLQAKLTFRAYFGNKRKREKIKKSISLRNKPKSCECPRAKTGEAHGRNCATHRAEGVSAQTAFAVQAADLCLGAGLGHSLKKWPV